MSIRYPSFKKCIDEIKTELNESKKDTKKTLAYKKVKPICYVNGKLLVEVIE